MPAALDKIAATFSDAEVVNFWSRVDDSGGPERCWPWLNALSGGYGKFWTEEKKLVYSHRYVCTLAHGPIPEGQDAHHTCDNPWCCNPDHVVPRSKSDHGRLSAMRRYSTLEHQFLGNSIAELCEEQLSMLQITQGEDLEPSKKNLSIYSLALIDEVLELVREIGVKPWKERGLPDKQRVAAEYADILAFLGTLTHFVLAQTGLTPVELAQAYRDKVAENYRRFSGQVVGYETLLTQELLSGSED